MWTEPFLFADGTLVSSIEQLKLKLESSTDALFFMHVTTDRNDFSNWISHMGEKRLAEFTQTIKDRQTMVNVFKHYLDSNKSKQQPESLVQPTPSAPVIPPAMDQPIPDTTTSVAQVPTVPAQKITCGTIQRSCYSRYYAASRTCSINSCICAITTNTGSSYGPINS